MTRDTWRTFDWIVALVAVAAIAALVLGWWEVGR